MKALVGAFNQEKALVGAFSVIVQPVVEPMNRFAALLRNVTGDIGPLLSSLSCTRLVINNTELDQAATSSLVQGLQHGVEKLVLQSGVRLHIQTMVEWEGKGRCDEVYWHDTRNTDREKMKTWAARVGWNKKDYGTYTVMRRNTGIGF